MVVQRLDIFCDSIVCFFTNNYTHMTLVWFGVGGFGKL